MSESDLAPSPHLDLGHCDPGIHRTPTRAEVPSLASAPTVDAVTESSVSSWGAAAIWGALVFIGTDSPVHCGKVCLQPVDEGSTPVPPHFPKFPVGHSIASEKGPWCRLTKVA